MTAFADEAARQRDLAARLREAAAEAELQARHFDAGDSGEADVAGILSPLEAAGWIVLRKRRWPGTRNADLDLVLVGPPGVVVLDAKNWKGNLRIRHGRLFREQADESDCIVGMVAQVDAVAAVLAERQIAPVAVTGSLVFTRQPLAPLSLGRVHAMGGAHLLAWLTALPVRFGGAEVTATAQFLHDQLPAALPSQKPARPLLPRRPRPRGAVPQEALFEARELDLAELRRTADMGLEEWMTFLHPSQLDVVRRRFAGPSRVRGPAGCGKTVVALHRAAFLAGSCDGNILITSYVKTLPAVLANLYQRLSPPTAHRLTCAGVHSLAFQVLREASILNRYNREKVEQAWRAAWLRHASQLQTAALTEDYWREEVCAVIKGRGLERFEDYADLARVGRRTALQAGQRRAVWDLYVDYTDQLTSLRAWDFDDVLTHALSLAQDGHAPQFRFVIVDECQDLTLQGLRFLNALVAHEADGLTLVGDGQQAIYPGGFTLKEAGITVTGRGAVLSANYRNAADVLARAKQIVQADDFDDLEDVNESGDRTMTVVRPGGKVLEVTVQNRLSAMARLVERLVEDRRNGFPVGHAAVLVQRRADAAHVRRRLTAVGISTIDLEEYGGLPVDAVKVGTTKRAKGLEFTRVYLPFVDDYILDPAKHEVEQVQRARRELFVAMTRARDGLWLCRQSSVAAGV